MEYKKNFLKKQKKGKNLNEKKLKNFFQFLDYIFLLIVDIKGLKRSQCI